MKNIKYNHGRNNLMGPRDASPSTFGTQPLVSPTFDDKESEQLLYVQQLECSKLRGIGF